MPPRTPVIAMEMRSSRVRKRSKSVPPVGATQQKGPQAAVDTASRVAHATESEQRSPILDRSRLVNFMMIMFGALIFWLVQLWYARHFETRFNPRSPAHRLLEDQLLRPQAAQAGVAGCHALFRGSPTPLDDIVFQLNAELGLFNTNYPNMTQESQLNPRYFNKTDHFQALNGQTPPGKLFPVQDEKVILDVINHQGQRVVMLKSVRKPGTRVGIHMHPYGGYVMVLKGELTDFVQGQPAQSYGPNSPGGPAYYMPACTLMSVANVGDEDAELVDLLIGPPGKPYLHVLELGWKWNRTESFTDCRLPKCDRETLLEAATAATQGMGP